MFLLVRRDFAANYWQSLLGAGWAFVNPIYSLILTTIVFGKLAGFPSGGMPYPVFLYAAMLPWDYLKLGWQRVLTQFLRRVRADYVLAHGKERTPVVRTLRKLGFRKLPRRRITLVARTLVDEFFPDPFQAKNWSLCLGDLEGLYGRDRAPVDVCGIRCRTRQRVVSFPIRSWVSTLLLSTQTNTSTFALGALVEVPSCGSGPPIRKERSSAFFCERATKAAAGTSTATGVGGMKAARFVVP